MSYMDDMALTWSDTQIVNSYFAYISHSCRSSRDVSAIFQSLWQTTPAKILPGRISNRSAEVAEYEKQMLEFMETKNSELLKEIMDSGIISDELEEKLKKALDEFKTAFQPSA